MYSKLINHISEAYSIAEDIGIEDQALSKSLLDIVLANHLGHHLSEGGRGSDAFDAQQRHYEYKCTFTGQCIFHFGSNNGIETNIAFARKKFQQIEGCYYAEFDWSGIVRIAYCPMPSFLPQLENHIKFHLKAGQFQWHHNWDTFTRIPNCEVVNSIGEPTYPDLANSLVRAFGEANRLGLEVGLFSKGGHNHVLLAQREGHTLSEGGGGPDAHDSQGNYEYKISYKDRWNFNFGARKGSLNNRRLIRQKCDSIVAAYLVTRRYAELTRIIRIPAAELCRLLLQKEEQWGGGQLTLNIDRGDLRRFVIFPNPDFEWMSVTELKTQLRELGLPIGGRKSELIERLIQHHNGS